MTATLADIAALLAAVEAAPDDEAPRLILADALEEAGCEWAGLLRTRVPNRSGDDPERVYWHPCLPDHSASTLAESRHWIPYRKITKLLRPPGGDWDYPNAGVAYADLARAVCRLAGVTQ